MIKKIFICACISLGLLGCGEVKAPQNQVDLVNYFEKIKDKLKEIEKSNNAILLKEAENKVKETIKSQNFPVNQWYGEVQSITQKGDAVVVLAAFENQEYTLVIIDSDAKSAATTLKKGDDIYFSGNMGRERSITLSGTLSNPEFSFMPKSIKVANNSYSQSPELIQAKLNQARESLKQKNFRRQVIMACQKRIRELYSLSYRDSFSAMNMQAKKIADDQWGYINKVVLKDVNGHKKEMDVYCTASVKMQDKDTMVITETKVAIQ